MDKETLKALKASIKHWQENVDAETPEQASVSGEDCALCELAEKRTEYEYNDDCCNCPVKHKTGVGLCGETPWCRAAAELSWWRARRSGEAKLEWQKAAQAELDFLKSLLPQE